jgi:predicted flap endonuclease-1-like 5' DNA nuclease
MAKIVDVEGIGPKYAEKLNRAGVSTTDGLLKVGATPKGRKEIAEKTGIGDALILEWVNHVDLYRIKGVGSEYSDYWKPPGWIQFQNWLKEKPPTLPRRWLK